MNEGKCVVYLVKNGVEEKWSSFDNREVAQAWIDNYNVNSQRPKTFVIKSE